MKTSASQFYVMITFMEQHGDLSKPSCNARGRIACIKNWEQLTELLNSDDSGDVKTTEKWKKVWSDFKNNTKKKAARLHRAARGTDGGPAAFAKLTDLELRVLNLTGQQVATGLAVEEAGVSQVINNRPSNTNVDREDTQTLQSHYVKLPVQNTTNPVSSQSPLLPSRRLSFEPSTNVKETIQIPQHWNEPGPSTSRPVTSPPLASSSTAPPLSYKLEIQVEDTGNLSPSDPISDIRVGQTAPARTGQTTARRARVAHARGLAQRRLRLAHTELAAKHFLRAKKQWRKFKEQQHKDYMDMRREQNRIRELEIETQRTWQTLGLRALDMLDKLVNEYCKD